MPVNLHPISKQALGRVDRALYRAKVNGRAQCASYDQDIASQQQQLAEIKAGIAAGEFAPWYQPIVNAQTLEVAGYEALARWTHDGKVIGPGEFIELLEESRNLHLLDRSIFAQIAKDRAAVSPAWISVNISPYTLERPDFREIAAPLLADKSIPLEITERFKLSVEAQLVLGELKLGGHILKLDDFGVGESRLQALADGAVDGIKIDMSIVKLLHASDSQKRDRGFKLCSALVLMARTLGLSTVAEGVEHAEQVEALQLMGCDYLQGYRFGKPAPLA